MANKRRTDVSLKPMGDPIVKDTNTNTVSQEIPATSEPIQVTPNLSKEETVPMSVVESLMKQMQELQGKVKEIENPTIGGTTKAGRERYKGPRIYGYTMYQGKAMVSMVTNEEKSKNYQNTDTKQWVYLQIVNVTFHDGTTIEIDYETFMRNRKKSDQMVPLSIEDKVYMGILQPHYQFALNGQSFFIPNAHIN